MKTDFRCVISCIIKKTLVLKLSDTFLHQPIKNEARRTSIQVTSKDAILTSENLLKGAKQKFKGIIFYMALAIVAKYQKWQQETERQQLHRPDHIQKMEDFQAT